MNSFDSLSVTIPFHNDPSGVEDTVERIIQSRFDGELEIVIVDNNSTDNTYYVAQSHAAGHDRVHAVVEDDIQSS